jgi:hypothetical protein
MIPNNYSKEQRKLALKRVSSAKIFPWGTVMIGAVTSTAKTQHVFVAKTSSSNFGAALAAAAEKIVSTNGNAASIPIVSSCTTPNPPLDVTLPATTEEKQDSISDTARSGATTQDNAVAAREYSLLKTRGLSADEINKFQDIKDQAASATSAKTFLLGLSTDDRALVKKANSYGMKLSDSQLQSMTEEGARNMIVTQDRRAYVDYNNDGVVDKGVAKTFSFPPPNAPEEVKDAWDKTVESIPEKDLLMASSVFMLQTIQANIKTNEQGNPVGIYFPGGDGYINIFPTTRGGWQDLLDKTDEYLNWVASVDRGNSRLEENRAIVAAFRNNPTA